MISVRYGTWLQLLLSMEMGNTFLKQKDCFWKYENNFDFT